MEVESRSEEMLSRETQAWRRAWLQAWPRAKRVAMEVEVMLGRSQQPWGEAWTKAWAAAKAEMGEGVGEWAQECAQREWVLAGALAQELVRAKAKAKAQAQATTQAKELVQTLTEASTEALGTWSSSLDGAYAKLAEARARAKIADAEATKAEARVEEAEVRANEAEARAQAAEAAAKAEAEALAVAGSWVWARTRTRTRARGQTRESGEKMPAAVADSSTIWHTLISLNRSGIARDLWDRSPETRDEYSSITHFIAPITRLPFELFHQIFLITIDQANGPPVVLMLVCKHWYTIVTSIWASLNLGTRTPLSAVTNKLERSQWFLDIVMDTDSDRGDFDIPSHGAFEAIFAAVEASSRWRSLVLESFPGQADLSEEVVNRGLQRCPNATMSRFTTFKVKSTCKTSPFLNGLLHILGTTAGSELTTVEINSANVISFLAPAYPSMFYSVKILSLDALGINNPVDLLPYLHQLESFTASHISFPIYRNDVELPFIRTLRHLRLKAVSIQWMSSRTFHVLEDCTIIFPLHHNILHAFSTALPNCKYLTFQGYPLEILGGVFAPGLTQLSVICSGSFNRRGSRQLVRFSCQALRDRRLSPQILHIGIGAMSQAWICSLTLMPYLEELVIESAEPSSLGAKVFQSFVVRLHHTRDIGATSTPGMSGTPLCPSLKRFRLKYRRWLRQSEHFSLISDFMSIIMSREGSIYALKSFSIWMTNSQTVPVELIRNSRLSYGGLERLVNKNRFDRDMLSWIFQSDWGRHERKQGGVPGSGFGH